MFNSGASKPRPPGSATCGGTVLTVGLLKYHVSIKPILFVQAKQRKCPDPC